MSFENWWDKLNGTSTELFTDDEKVAKIGFEAGWDAGQAELREPSPCKVDGHTMADWSREEKPSEMPGPQGRCVTEWCRACEREKEIWDLAHSPASCGHARANYKDPKFGTSEYRGEERCEACEREAALRRKVEAAQRLADAVRFHPFQMKAVDDALKAYESIGGR